MASRGNPEYMQFAHRTIMAAGRRVAAGDCADLARLRGLQASVNDAVDMAVTGLIAEGFSIGDIARELGISRQAVHQRYGVAITAGYARREAVAS